MISASGSLLRRNEYKLLQSVSQVSMFYRPEKLNKWKSECWTLGVLFLYVRHNLGCRTPFIDGIVICFLNYRVSENY